MSNAASAPDKAVLECDLHKLELGPSGIAGYYWPITTAERKAFSLSLSYAYTDVIRARRETDEEAPLPYQFFGIIFLSEVIAVFQGDLLRERCAAQNLTVNVPDTWPYWPKLLREEMPKDPPALESLQTGPAKPNYSKRVFSFRALKKIFGLLKLSSSALAVDGLKIKPITDAVLQDAIIATQRTSLIVRHAAEQDKDVVFSRSPRWYRPITDEERDASIQDNDPDLETAILQAIAEQFEAHGAPLKAHSKAYFESLLRLGPALLRVHYRRLLAEPAKLPKEIWTGTGGNVWDCMLRVAVRSQGGKASGHDHGSGMAQAVYPTRALSEYWGCTSFVTFNANHASECKREAETYPLYEGDLPIFEHVRSKLEIRKLRPRYGQPKTVFLMVSVYDNDRGRLGTMPGNHEYMDWQIRLVALLLDLGFHVVVKLHPENRVALPPIFTDLGAELTTEPFGNMIDRADLVIFDYIHTSTFTEALATTVPILLAERDTLEFTAKGRELIATRCGIAVSQENAGRKVIAQEDLSAAVQDAVARNENDSFYGYYFI